MEVRLGRGFHEARHGWSPAEGRDEEEVAAAEARDGALRSLACISRRRWLGFNQGFRGGAREVGGDCRAAEAESLCVALGRPIDPIM